MDTGSARRHVLLALVGTALLACAQPPPETQTDGEGGTPGGSGGGGSGGSGSGGQTRSGGRGGGTGGAAVSGGTGGAALTPDAATPDAAAPDIRPADTADSPPSSTTASEACAKPHMVPAEGMRELQVGAEARKFILRLPSGYDGKKPWPVIFVFHGAGQSAGTFDNNTDLRAVMEEKAVLLFPDGPVKPDGRRSWVFRSPDNVVFVDALIDWAKKSLCIDPSRLFATGLSSGGYMSLTLGCQRGDVFRAVTTASGGMVEKDNCRGNPNVWVRLGKGDRASTIDSVTQARDFWLQHKGCQRDNPKPIEPAPCVSYAGCQGGASVVFCADGGGHGWPAYYSKAIWGEFSRP